MPILIGPDAAVAPAASHAAATAVASAAARSPFVRFAITKPPLSDKQTEPARFMHTAPVIARKYLAWRGRGAIQSSGLCCQTIDVHELPADRAPQGLRADRRAAALGDQRPALAPRGRDP